MTCFSPGVLLLRLAFVALCLFHLLLCPHHSTAASTHRLLDTQGSQSYDYCATNPTHNCPPCTSQACNIVRPAWVIYSGMCVECVRACMRDIGHLSSG